MISKDETQIYNMNFEKLRIIFCNDLYLDRSNQDSLIYGIQILNALFQESFEGKNSK